MRIFSGILFAAVIAFAVVWGLDDGESQTGRYDNVQYWYQTGKAVDPELCDVFYVLETCVHDWTDSEGVVRHHADVDNSQHRAAMEPVFQRAYEIFGDSVNFFAPYYSQITMQVWEEGAEAVDKQYPKAFGEIKAAFDYYMRHLNGGRRFALAGFSQGGKAVKDLVRTMTDEQFARMAAAYVIGFPVLAEDVEGTDRFVAAKAADDTGVTISYNSVDTAEGIGDFFRGSTMIINPVSWSTSSEIAQVNDTATVHIDTETMTLQVDGVDPNTVYLPSFPTLLPYGNLHLLELPLYAPYLSGNVKTRLYGR